MSPPGVSLILSLISSFSLSSLEEESVWCETNWQLRDPMLGASETIPVELRDDIEPIVEETPGIAAGLGGRSGSRLPSDGSLTTFSVSALVSTFLVLEVPPESMTKAASSLLREETEPVLVPGLAGEVGEEDEGETPRVGRGAGAGGGATAIWCEGATVGYGGGKGSTLG